MQSQAGMPKQRNSREVQCRMSCIRIRPRLRFQYSTLAAKTTAQTSFTWSSLKLRSSGNLCTAPCKPSEVKARRMYPA